MAVKSIRRGLNRETRTLLEPTLGRCGGSRVGALAGAVAGVVTDAVAEAVADVVA
jgi:hypothetical protein